MDFKKLALATMIAGALAGCNSSDDNNSDNTPGPNPTIEAFFQDSAAVKGAAYNCANGTETGVTDINGSFTVTSGSSCIMSIDGFTLGKTGVVTAQNSVISSTQLQQIGISPARSKNVDGDNIVKFNARLSSLLQSIDADLNTPYIDTRETKGSSIPTDLLTKEVTAEAFIEMLEEVEVAGEKLGDTGNIVTPDDAEDNLRGGYESEAIKRVIAQVSRLFSGHELEANLENELSDIRAELESYEISSNGYHQEALLAIIEILEVVNSQEVSDRIDIEGSLFNYKDMLPKVLDYTFNDNAEILFKGEQGSTDDIAVVLFEAAERLVAASQKLGNAFPNENYELPYEELNISYHDSLYLRAYALNIANALSIASAYTAGNDNQYVPQPFEATDVTVFEGWQDRETGKFERSVTLKDFEGEFIKAFVDNGRVLDNPEVFQLRKNVNYLVFAKQALIDSIPLIKALELDDADTVDFINNLEQHLNAEDGDRTPLVIEEDGEEISINLHAFYSVENGIDRNAFEISFNGYTCPEGISGAYDETFSKIFNDTICSHNENIEDGWGFDWDLIREVGYEYDEENNRYIYQVIPAVYANTDLDIMPTDDLNRVAWCGMEDGEKLSCFE